MIQVAFRELSRSSHFLYFQCVATRIWINTSLETRI